MARIKSLGLFQKVVLAVVLAMVVVFTVVYAVTTARVGFSYKDAILVPAQEDDTTVYTGKVQGKNARITVDPDGIVTFQYDDKTFGPYTVREDPSAIPEELTEDYDMTGVEIRCGEDVFFRGCMNTFAGHRFLYNEDGSAASIRITYTAVSGEIQGAGGNVIDPLEPDSATILELLDSPALTHRGDWLMWFLGIVLCGATAVSILFVNELFRFHLSFQIQNAETAEPSEWEMATRYLSWTVVPIGAFAIFIIGLQ